MALCTGAGRRGRSNQFLFVVSSLFVVWLLNFEVHFHAFFLLLTSLLLYYYCWPFASNQIIQDLSSSLTVSLRSLSLKRCIQNAIGDCAHRMT